MRSDACLSHFLKGSASAGGKDLVLALDLQPAAPALGLLSRDKTSAHVILGKDRQTTAARAGFPQRFNFQKCRVMASGAAANWSVPWASLGKGSPQIRKNN